MMRADFRLDGSANMAPVASLRGPPPRALLYSSYPDPFDMKHFLPITSALLLAGGLSAQSVSGMTATDLGNAVKAGTKVSAHAVKKGTKIGTRGLRASSYLRGTGFASSSTKAGKFYDRRTRKTGIYGNVSDHGSLYSRISTGGGSANTTGNGGKAGAHGSHFMFSAAKAVKGKMTLYVFASASKGGGASATASAGGKTLSAKAGDKPKTMTFVVTLDSKGMAAMASTSGKVALKGRGRMGYRSYASVSFVADSSTGGGGCKIVTGAKGCGPVLKGTAGSSFFGKSVKLELSGAAKNAVGLLLFSPDGKTVSIKGCPLFSKLAHVAVFRTDKDGKSTQRLRIPRGRDVKVSVEDVVLTFSAKGIDFKSSNTLNISCSK